MNALAPKTVITLAQPTLIQLTTYEKFRNAVIDMRAAGYTKRGMQDTLDIVFEEGAKLSESEPRL